MKTLARALALVLSFAAAASAASTRRIVVFNDSTPVADRMSIAGAQGRVIRTLDIINAIVVETPPVHAAAAVSRLKSDPNVVRVDDDPKINWLQNEAPASFQQLPLPELSSFP